jgi:hypothetical protein
MKLLPLREDCHIELRYLLIKRDVKLLPLMEDFLIELRYLLIKKGDEAPPLPGVLAHLIQVVCN